MSLSSLPQELVDQIACLAGNDEEGLHHVIDVKSLYNFCLISERTISSGQACLYRRPFISLTSIFEGRSGGNKETEVQFAEDRIVKLLTALEANDNRLGRLVRGTLGISYYLMILGEDDQNRKWYIEVLRACPNLREVNLNFGTTTELEAILEALHLLAPVSDTLSSQNPSHPSLCSNRLDSVVFDHCFRLARTETAIDPRRVFAVLERTSIPLLDTVTFANVRWRLDPATSSTPLFPLPCKHLRIMSISSPLAECIPLFPLPASTLETFSFSSLILKTIDLTSLRPVVGVHLKKLVLKLMEDPRFDDLTLSNYTTFTPHSTLILDNFVSFPVLTSLTLDSIHGPSLCFLAKLAKALPLLRILDLHNSRWISDSNSLSTIPDEIFPEAPILSALEQFKHVDEMNLSLLPTTSKERYPGLVKTLESRGVKMSFSSLPEELVDLIIYESELFGTISLRRDGKTLLSLCLVSRQTLNPARQALYRYPFWSIYPYKFNWRRANSLLTSLKANDKTLGQLVQGINPVTQCLKALIRDGKERNDAVNRTMHWFKQLLEACPHLRQVELSFKTVNDFENLLEALSLGFSCPKDRVLPGPSSLRILVFSRLFYDDEEDGEIDAEGQEHPELRISDRFNTADIFNALGRTSITSLHEVRYHNVGFEHSGYPSNEAQFQFPVKSLRIDSHSYTLATCIPLLPRDHSTLEHFKFSGEPPLDSSEIQALPNLLGTTLRSLFLSLSRADQFYLSEYTLRSDAPPLPVETFRLFPHLTSLSLVSTHGPSTRLLELLATSSPAITHLSFLCSRWISDTDPQSFRPEVIFPEMQILSSLSKFKHLKDIYLGTLPTTNYNKYKGLKSSLEAEGIKGEYECCIRRNG